MVFPFSPCVRVKGIKIKIKSVLMFKSVLYFIGVHECILVVKVNTHTYILTCTRVYVNLTCTHACSLIVEYVFFLYKVQPVQ